MMVMMIMMTMAMMILMKMKKKMMMSVRWTRAVTRMTMMPVVLKVPLTVFAADRFHALAAVPYSGVFSRAFCWQPQRGDLGNAPECSFQGTFRAMAGEAATMLVTLSHLPTTSFDSSLGMEKRPDSLDTSSSDSEGPATP